jgi:hypothetical protein
MSKQGRKRKAKTSANQRNKHFLEWLRAVRDNPKSTNMCMIKQ